MRKLEEQAEACVHEFNSLGVANSLWAYATQHALGNMFL